MRPAPGEWGGDAIIVEVTNADEWIVTASCGGRSLHVFRVTAGDWLVSEVGRRTEGRGADLDEALAALSRAQPAADWWRGIPAALKAASGVVS